MTDKKKLVLVDGSSYLFRAFFALPPLTAPDGSPTGVIYGVVNMLKNLLNNEEPDCFAIVFDGRKKTFRHALYAEYKAHRPETPPDLVAQFVPLMNLLKKLAYPVLTVETYEADDVLGTLAMQGMEKNFAVTIVTGDKDLMQLVRPGITLFDPMKRKFYDTSAVKEKLGVLPDQVIDFLSLVGDTSDNIPGIRGVGPKTAVRWLEKYGNLEQLLVHCSEVKEKVGKKLSEQKEELALFRKLVTIDCAVPLKEKIEDMHLGVPDIQAIEKIYKQLNFTSLLDALELKKPDAPIASGADTGAEAVQTVTDLKTLQAWIQRIKQCGLCCVHLDMDNKGTFVGKNRMRGIAFALNQAESMFVPLAGDKENTLFIQAVKPLLESATIKKTGFDLKQLCVVFLHHGIRLQGIVDDVMLLAYVLNSAASSNDLPSLCEQHLDERTAKEIKELHDNQGNDSVLPGLFATRAAMVCLQLHQVLTKQIKNNKAAWKFYQETELPLTSVLGEIEYRGVCLDKKELARQGGLIEKETKKIQEEIYTDAGYSLNLDSPKQIQKLLFEEKGFPILKKTKKGQASTDEEVLQALATEFSLPARILRYRSLNKLLSTYIQPLQEFVQPETGRVHTHYHQALTTTGRLSSSAPNLQNIPIRTKEGRKIRKAFVAPADCVLLAADYSQIELRLMAHISQDKNMCKAFHEEEDIHRLTASEVFHTPFSKVTAADRSNAKAINFGLIYGMQAFSLSKQLGVSVQTAKEYLEMYFARYPGVREYMEEIKKIAHDQGYVETLAGRRIYIPQIDSRHAPTRLYAERAAINAPMQGSAAEIIKRAMVSLHASIVENNLNAGMIMQVHDELVLEVAQHDLESLVIKCRQIMVHSATLDVPIVVNIGTGKTWDKAH